MLRHTLITVGMLLSLLGCSQSPKYLESLQAQIQDELVQQGGSSLQSVTCPVPAAATPEIICVGILPSGNAVDIAAKAQADQTYSWRIPSIKGLLNMAQIQEAIAADLGDALSGGELDCGIATNYKIAEPGEQFNCLIQPATVGKTGSSSQPFVDAATDTKSAKVSNKPPPGKITNQSSPTAKKIAITILPSGDVNWQAIDAANSKTKTAKSSSKSLQNRNQSAQSTSETKSNAQPADRSATTAAPNRDNQAQQLPQTSAAPPAQSAEEALNAPDALEGWDD